MEDYYLVSDNILKIKLEKLGNKYNIFVNGNIKEIKEFDGYSGLRIVELTKKKIIEEYEGGKLIYKGFLF